MRRGRRTPEAAREEFKLFYCSDIHGSERCFRKMLNTVSAYGVDAIVFGGDIAGKTLIPIVRNPGETYGANLFGEPVEARGEDELRALQDRIRVRGSYFVVLDPEERAGYDQDPARVARDLFPTVVSESIRRWMHLADERLQESGATAYLMLGNDDYEELSPLLVGENVANAEDGVVELPGGFEMISLGFSNRTPWATPRELDEDDLAVRIAALVGKLSDPTRAVFNLHVPPHDTHLDQAALLDKNLRPIVRHGQIAVGGVGSTAVREALVRYQPFLSLHGHIHESGGVHRLGRTTAMNPGSDYGNGVLNGLLISLSRRRGLGSWQFVRG